VIRRFFGLKEIEGVKGSSLELPASTRKALHISLAINLATLKFKTDGRQDLKFATFMATLLLYSFTTSNRKNASLSPLAVRYP